MIEQTLTNFRIDPATEVGALALSVADLTAAVQFYTQVLGFQILEREEQQITLGVAAQPLLILIAQPHAQPRPLPTTGLYHFAILLPSRADLGVALRQLVASGYPLDGGSDHLVSEALYLTDPEGNGIEMYRDRPQAEWRWQDGKVQMASVPVDYAGLLADAEGRPWQGLPQGTKIGHIHLQVGDIAQAQAFYHDVLGFDVVAHMPSALFVSAGGYHHHIGMNTWQSRNAPRPPAQAVGLRTFTITVPTATAQQQIAQRLTDAGIPFQTTEQRLLVDDPWGNTMSVELNSATATID